MNIKINNKKVILYYIIHMYNYKEKYLKYKLKYLNLKNIN
jgi:hypothetical protein